MLNSLIFISSIAPRSTHFVHCYSLQRQSHKPEQISLLQGIQYYRQYKINNNALITTPIQASNTNQDVPYLFTLVFVFVLLLQAY